ncbi:MAG TPA: sulfotransferase [Oscillatoriales cyanobacterium M59_W2019_021]|nr:sulfotransferase [Oscillatoriales cyanobacterium M4454_W2019_049]HIK49615.1 sulfotransferase [Oscillatoriales cyanobacterium M59_W2019_021]
MSNYKSEISTWIESLQDISNQFYPSQSIHEKKLDSFFGKHKKLKMEEIPNSVRNKDAFLICFTNRCGSNLLTELLYQAGLDVIKTHEPLNFNFAIKLCKKYKIESFPNYLSHLILNNSNLDNNFFGFKTGSHQLFWMSRKGYLHIFKSLKFIYIKRRNLIDQAVSLYKASQNKQWHSKMVSSISDDCLECDPFEVLKVLKGITQRNSFFEYFFSIHSIDACTVYYEDLVSDTEGTLKNIFTYLGIKQDDVLIPSLDRSRIGKQADLFNKNCTEKFISRYRL